MLSDFHREGMKILRERGLNTSFVIKTNGRLKNVYGRCTYHNRLIELSSEFIRQHGWVEARKVFLHELSHLIAFLQYGEKGHGLIFLKVCGELGGTVNNKDAAFANCFGIDLDTAERLTGKYVYTCPCGVVYNRFRKIKPNRICGKCKFPVAKMKLEIN